MMSSLLRVFQKKGELSQQKSRRLLRLHCVAGSKEGPFGDAETFSVASRQYEAKRSVSLSLSTIHENSVFCASQTSMRQRRQRDHIAAVLHLSAIKESSTAQRDELRDLLTSAVAHGGPFESIQEFVDGVAAVKQ